MIERTQITFDMLIEYAADKNIKAECPTCGSVNMTSMEVDMPGWGTELLLDGSKNMDNAKIVSAITMICTNCGFIRLFAREIIEKWIDEKGEMEDSNAE